MNYHYLTMRKQFGAVLLMLSHFFLLAALALSMAAYSGIASQYKNSQNEIAYRKQFWLSEAGLECAFALFAHQSVNEGPKLVCGLTSNLEVTWVTDDRLNYKVTSSVANLSLVQDLVVSRQPKYSVTWREGSWRGFY